MANPNEALYNAIENNDVKIVELLLKLDYINPTAENYYAFHRAVEKGNAEISKLLLNWKGPNWPERGQWIDPTYENYRAWRTALEKGNAEISRLLLNWKGPNWPERGQWIDPRAGLRSRGRGTVNVLTIPIAHPPRIS